MSANEPFIELEMLLRNTETQLQNTQSMLTAGLLYHLQGTLLDLLNADEAVSVTINPLVGINMQPPTSSSRLCCLYLALETDFDYAHLADAILQMLEIMRDNSAQTITFHLYLASPSGDGFVPEVLDTKSCVQALRCNAAAEQIFNNELSLRLDELASNLVISNASTLTEQSTALTHRLSDFLACDYETADTFHRPHSIKYVFELASSEKREQSYISAESLRYQLENFTYVNVKWLPKQGFKKPGIHSSVSELMRRRGFNKDNKWRCLLVQAECKEYNIIAEIVDCLSVDFQKDVVVKAPRVWTVILQVEDRCYAKIKEALACKEVLFYDGFEDHCFNATEFWNAPLVKKRPSTHIIEEAAYTVRLVHLNTLTASGKKDSFDLPEVALFAVFGNVSKYEMQQRPAQVVVENMNAAGILEVLKGLKSDVIG